MRYVEHRLKKSLPAPAHPVSYFRLTSIVGTQVEKKFGMDPNKMRANNEKFSDMGREQFEKRTGKDIPDKVRRIFQSGRAERRDPWSMQVVAPSVIEN